MQMLLTKHVLDRVLVPNPPWSFEQAEQYCQYFLRCWHMNETFRSAWIDGGRLHLGDDVIPSTGGQERHHRDIDEHAFKCQLNRDVTSVAMAVSGMDCNGSLVKGILSMAEQEYEREKSMGQQRPPSMDISRRVTEAKACLELLLNGDSSYERRPGFCDFVRSFDKDMIRRRAEPGAMSQSPFPAVLQHLRESLAYGGRDSFQRVGWNALNAQDACECLSATYHGARSAWGKCKHARYRSWCLRVHAAPDAAAVEVVYQEAEASLRQLIWGREKSRPQAVRCWELYDAANPKGGASRADLLAAMAVHPSLPPTGKGTGLTEVDEAELLWREVDEEEEEERTCEFGSVHDLGVVFSHSPSRSGELVVLGFVTLASGAPGPATHGGSRLTPGAQIVGVMTSCGEQEIQLSVAGELCVQGEAPLQLRFRPQPLALVADAAAAPDLTEVSSGRSAARVAKYSSDSAYPVSGRKKPRGPEPGGAPARRGKKPQSSRAENRRTVEVLPATTAAAQRVADLQAKLADTATLRELFVDVEDDFTSFVP